MEDNNEINIEDYIGLVKSLASKYTKLGLSFDDLVQEGVLGLIEAKKRFDAKKETAFSTYASYWIKNKIIEAIRNEKKSSLYSVELNDTVLADLKENEPEAMVKRENKISIPEDFPKLEKKVLDYYFNYDKTYNEISEILKISREKVRQQIKKALRRLQLTKH